MRVSDSRTDAHEPGAGLRVASKRCDECLLSSAKIVPDERRDQILGDCAKDGRYFLCHKAPDVAVVCRGFFDTQPNRACQVASRLGYVKLVDVAGGPNG